MSVKECPDESHFLFELLMGRDTQDPKAKKEPVKRVYGKKGGVAAVPEPVCENVCSRYDLGMTCC
jgi:hypothetical protein